jgi:LAO/AO transport system kinase
MTPDPMTDLAARVVAREARAIARAISLVEDDGAAGRELVSRIYPRTGRAFLVGVTGAPGTGKSTLVDRLIGEIRRAGVKVGVLAVDPTSPFSGGAVLGDRVRMNAHATDPDVFIRSMATRGHLGGLSRATADAALILDAAGTEVVVIETVGVGQDEVDIVSTADISLLLLVPGTGDDLQAIKAGVMEIADIFVINKADREGADRVVQAVAANLALKAYESSDWKPPIVKTEATTGAGVDLLWNEIGRFRAWAATHAADRRRQRHLSHLRDALALAFLRHLDRTLPAGTFDRFAEAVSDRTRDPYSLVDEIMSGVLPESRSPGPDLRQTDPHSRTPNPAQSGTPNRESRVPDR